MSETTPEHGEKILAAIIGTHRKDLLDLAVSQLRPEHFPDQTQKIVFQMLGRYNTVGRGGILTSSALADMLKLSKTDPGRAALLLETFESLEDRDVAEDEFHWAVSYVQEVEAERQTREAFTVGMEVLKGAFTDDEGNEVQGHAAAREVVLDKFAEIESGLSVEQAREGDTGKNTNSVYQDYLARKEDAANGIRRGLGFGVQNLDRATGGMQPGELVLVAGYSNDGKSSLCIQAAWSAAVEQGKNAVILTMETPYDVVYRKLISRHSRLPQFELPQGLNTRDLKGGTLSAVEENRLVDVLKDYEAGTYGVRYLAQLPYGSNMETITAKLRALSRSFRIDLVVIDYLGLLRSTRKRQSKREELSEILIAAKELATTFNNGQGVTVLSPWQVNRTSYEEALRLNYYTSAALAETAEATNSSDLVVSILAPVDNDDRTVDLKSQILKARDGATYGDLKIKVDYATSAFWSAEEGGGRIDPADLTGPVSPLSGLVPGWS